MAIWYILWSFGIFLPVFGVLYQEKSGSPDPQFWLRVKILRQHQENGLRRMLPFSQRIFLAVIVGSNPARICALQCFFVTYFAF
jgi:hypothetical protein